MDVFGFGQPAAPPSRESLLVTAASRGNLDRVTCLLDDEVKVVKVTELVNGFNALHSAAKKNHISIVELLVRRHPSLISCRTEDERTAEMVAAFEGHADLLSILRNEIVGESPVSFTEECTDSKKNTSLHYAAWGGSLECVKFLVETCKMNPAAKNLEGMTAVQFASAGNHALIVAYLSSVSNQGEDNNISSESGYNSLHRACIYGAVDTVNYLLQSKQIDCDSVSGSGSTALHIACQNGQLAIVKMLIEVYEADYDVQNNYGLTPLHSACARYYYLWCICIRYLHWWCHLALIMYPMTYYCVTLVCVSCIATTLKWPACYCSTQLTPN